MRLEKDITRFVQKKRVFIGIDVHQKFWVVCSYCDGEILEKITIHDGFSGLFSMLKKYDSARSVKLVYEAGFSGSWLYHALKDAGYDVIITAPSLIPKTANKVKTDKRDAYNLARYLAAGVLTSIYVLPPWAEANRSLIRRRRQVVKARTRVKAQIRSLLNLHGICSPDGIGKGWSKGYVNWLRDIVFDHHCWRTSLDQLLDEYDMFSANEKQLYQHLETLGDSDTYRADYKRLTAAKGIGVITAMTYLLEVHDFTRFANTKQFSSMLGLTPSQHSSGEHVRLGRITRQGSSHLRAVLVECAWTVIRYDTHLRAKYDRIRSRGTNGKKAIVAVARSMAVRMRRCLLDGVDYDMNAA